MQQTTGLSLSGQLSVRRLMLDFYYEIPQDFDHPDERHPGWEFVYVDKGKISVSADDATYVLKKGELVCHKPFQLHKLRPYEGQAAVIILCFEADHDYMTYFNNKILSVNQRQKQYLNDIVDMGKQVFRPKPALQIAAEGRMEPSDDTTGLQVQWVKTAVELLLLSLMHADTTEKQSRITLYSHVSQRKALTKNIIAYLQENLHRAITLEEISGSFSYSLSSIKRIFKEETGMSIIAYLNKLRMQRAQTLLRTTDAPINQIALSLGYANVYYFSLAFRKKIGVSPSTYRARP